MYRPIAPTSAISTQMTRAWSIHAPGGGEPGSTRRPWGVATFHPMDGRHCARPGCDTVAAAKLTYDYARRTVWLDPFEGELEVGAWGMCAAHADGLRVPVGWARDDRRTPIIPIRRPLAV